VLKVPEPYVRITDFRDYAVEYALYVFIREVKIMREIDADLRDNVFETCRRYEIDLSTPSLLKIEK
jgi:small-conductance mechanosensitive channel